MSGNPIIQVDSLSKSHHLGQQEIPILREISFTIRQGDMVALLGPSGSGKTTLLNILGLIDQASAGNILLCGHDLQNKSVNRSLLRRSVVGSIFQQFHLLSQFSAVDNVCVPLAPVKSKFNVRERAMELLTRVGLGHRVSHLPAELSGGEQQRVAIARSLIHSPQILLCDEPTGNLDTANRDTILDLLSELNREGLTIVIATHDPEVAARCHYRYEIRDGHLLQKEQQ